VYITPLPLARASKATTRPTTRAGRTARTLGQKTGYPEADNASDLLATGGVSDTDRRFEAFRASSVETSADLGEVNAFSRSAAPHDVWDNEDPDYEWTGDVHASAWELRALWEYHAEVRRDVRTNDAALHRAGIDPAWLRQIDLGEIPIGIRYTRGAAQDAYQMPVRATRHSGTCQPPKKESDQGDVARLMKLSAARRAPYERALDGAAEWLTFDIVLAAEGGASYVELAKHSGVSDVTVAHHLGDAMRRLEDTGPMLREGHERVKAWLHDDIARANHDDRVVLRDLLTAPLLWHGDKATHAKMTAPTPLADAQRKQRETDAEVARLARVAKAKADADAVRALDAVRRDSTDERRKWLNKLPGRNETKLTEHKRTKMDGKAMTKATSALAIEWKDKQKADARKFREEAKARKNVAIVEMPFDPATSLQSIEWKGSVSPAVSFNTLSCRHPSDMTAQPMENDMLDDYLSYEDVASMRGCCVRQLQRIVREGKGPAMTRQGKLVRFARNDVIEWNARSRAA
jgi:hypothetical protein